MERFKLLTLLTFFSLALFSCKKESPASVIGQPAENLLIGKWNLQQERFAQYIDGATHVDTTYNASLYNIASVQFNKDGTFVSASSYSNGATDPGTFTTGNVSSGRYTFDNNTFGLSNSISGLRNGVAFFGGTIIGGSAPVITPISHLAQISVLTSSKLNLHTEYSYTYTVDNVNQIYKMVDNYYYTK